jgi:hypothetical protein
MAEVMVSRGLFQQILDAIAALRPYAASTMLRGDALTGRPGCLRETCILMSAGGTTFTLQRVAHLGPRGFPRDRGATGRYERTYPPLSFT